MRKKKEFQAACLAAKYGRHYFPFKKIKTLLPSLPDWFDMNAMHMLYESIAHITKWGSIFERTQKILLGILEKALEKEVVSNSLLLLTTLGKLEVPWYALSRKAQIILLSELQKTLPDITANQLVKLLNAFVHSHMSWEVLPISLQKLLIVQLKKNITGIEKGDLSTLIKSLDMLSSKDVWPESLWMKMISQIEKKYVGLDSLQSAILLQALCRMHKAGITALLQNLAQQAGMLNREKGKTLAILMHAKCYAESFNPDVLSAWPDYLESEALTPTFTITRPSIQRQVAEKLKEELPLDFTVTEEALLCAKPVDIQIKSPDGQIWAIEVNGKHHFCVGQSGELSRRPVDLKYQRLLRTRGIKVLNVDLDGRMKAGCIAAGLIQAIVASPPPAFMLSAQRSRPQANPILESQKPTKKSFSKLSFLRQ